MSTIDLAEAGRYIDVDHAPLSKRYVEEVARRCAIGRILVGRITADQFAARIRETTDANWSRAKLANLETARRNLTLADVQILATAFQSYGVDYIDVPWLLGEADSLTRDFPGYPNLTRPVVLHRLAVLPTRGTPSFAGARFRPAIDCAN